MPGATWDMYTSGPLKGQLIRPPTYTATADDATRVKVYLKLATPLGAYLYAVEDGLDHARMLDPRTTDAERAALVRDVVLGDERVAEITVGPDVSVDFDAEPGPELTVTLTARTITGAPFDIEI